MAKGTLEFNLDDFDDKMAFDRANKSTDMASSLWEFGYNTKKEFLNNLDKYESKYDVVDAIYAKFWEILSAHDVNLDNLLN